MKAVNFQWHLLETVNGTNVSTSAPTVTQIHSPSGVDAQEEFIVLISFTFILFFATFLVQSLHYGIKHRLISCSEKWRDITVKGLDVAVWSLLWYAFSVTLVVYNKWILNSWEGGFKYPVTISMVHMIMKLLLSVLAVKFFCRDQESRTDQLAVAESGMAKLTWSTYMCSAVPVGVTTALDIAASNASFLYVSIPLYTIVKSSSILFVLFFSILYRLQPIQFSLIIVVFLISAGVVMAVYGDTDFSALGFGLVLGASCVGGYRWALTQLLMVQIGSKLSALHTIYYISPAAAVTLIPFSLWLEGADLFSSKFVQEFHLFTLALMNTVGAGIFAFAMILVELELIKRTSSLSLAAISYVKQFLQIFLAMVVFGTVITLLNVFGMLLTVVGLFLYTYLKVEDSEHVDNVGEHRLIIGSDGQQDDFGDEFLADSYEFESIGHVEGNGLVSPSMNKTKRGYESIEKENFNGYHSTGIAIARRRTSSSGPPESTSLGEEEVDDGAELAVI